MAAPTLVPRASSASSASNDNTLTFALTTLFTPPSDCALPILTSSGTFNNYWIPGTDGGTTTFFGSAWSCYPSQFYLTNDLVPIYSPGACPTGFQIVSAATPLNPRVTYATCCPSDATVFSGAFCTAASTINEVTTISRGKSTILSGTYLFEYPPITVAWKSSDLSKFSPSSAPLLAYGSALATGVSVASTPADKPGATATKHVASSTASTAAQSSPTSTGLSTGAKAGIGAGVGVVALIAIGLLAWMLLRRRKKRESWPAPTGAGTGQSGASRNDERYEKRGNASDTTWHTYDQPRPQQPPQELDGRQSPWIRPELSSEDVRRELDSSKSVRR